MKEVYNIKYIERDPIRSKIYQASTYLCRIESSKKGVLGEYFAIFHKAFVLLTAKRSLKIYYIKKGKTVPKNAILVDSINEFLNNEFNTKLKWKSVMA